MRNFKTRTEAATEAKPGEYIMLHYSGSDDNKIWAVMSQEEREQTTHDGFITWERVEADDHE
jgi:hypothetical protein